MSQRPPPRLHIIFAGRKPRAVIFLRGPSNWYHVISWDTARDTFEHGAWFKGRIYEEKCDLSPDGELLLYFALKGSTWNTSYRGSWTALSRPPWLHALTLWPHGSTWGGGDCFFDDRIVILQGSSGTHPNHPLNGIEVRKGHCRKSRTQPEIEGAQWAGYDHSGYPVFTREGRLFRQLPRGDKALADFNGLIPQPREAPVRAKIPLPTRALNTMPPVRRKRKKRR